MKREQGATWQSLLSEEPYGLHFSVSGKGRKPTDAEVAEAKTRCPEAKDLVEVENPVKVNPYVRHYMTEDTAHILRQTVIG